MSREYILPKRFWEDHVDRALRCVCEGYPHDEDGLGELTSRGYRVTLVETDAKELLSDARHYSDYLRWGGDPSCLGLQTSARATVKRLTQ